MAFSGVMHEAMSIMEAEEVVAITASSSTRWPKRRRCYINRDREAVHFRLRHDYFDDDCVCPPPPMIILLPEVSYADDSFSKHYA
jgi:hypothetical protein